MSSSKLTSKFAGLYRHKQHSSLTVKPVGHSIHHSINNMEKWLKQNKWPSVSDTGQTDVGPQEKAKTESQKRQYKLDYIMFGFTSTGADPLQSLCFLCGEVLSWILKTAQNMKGVQYPKKVEHHWCKGPNSSLQ